MAIASINPVTNRLLTEFPEWENNKIVKALQDAHDAGHAWRLTGFDQRSQLLNVVADLLRQQKQDLAKLITLEMGKPITEARAEIEKCAWGCEYYAANAAAFLADEEVKTDAGKSLVAYLPLGCVLAIMPWNFPFWQAFRFAAPALMAGNTVVLKHASNVPQCALAIEQLFHQAGFAAGVFRTLLVSAEQTEGIIADDRIHAVTLTGSEAAGRRVAAIAGAHLKKTVLELGGSDAFVVLEDADIEQASSVGVTSRFLNTGQSCIAAKRFIVVDDIADTFVDRLKQKTQALVLGDPMDESTQIGPLARPDLREALHRQVAASIAAGAVPLLGCELPEGPGNFYPPSILDRVSPIMPVYSEEVFGPVAIVIRVHDESEAFRVCNNNRYGLGGSVWTVNADRGEAFARSMESGASFVNGLVKSDPRLPFGGIKASGYGRELSVQGIREFVNVKTIWIK